jgi:hypothetical protein
MNLVELNRIAARDTEGSRFRHAQGGRRLNINEAALRRADLHDRIVAGFEQIFGFTHAEVSDHGLSMTPLITIERAPGKHLTIQLATAVGAVGLEGVDSHFFRNGRKMGESESYEAPLIVSATRSRSGGFYAYCRDQRDFEQPVDFAIRAIKKADQTIVAAEETQAMIWEALKDEYLNPLFAERAQEITPVFATANPRGGISG